MLSPSVYEGYLKKKKHFQVIHSLHEINVLSQKYSTNDNLILVNTAKGV